MFKLRRILSIVKKELKELLRDKVSFITVLAVPLSMMLVFGYGLKLEIKHVPIGVLDYDKSYLSRELVSKLTSNGEYFTVKRYFSSRKQLDRALTFGDVRGALIFPFNFEKDFKRGRAKFQLLVDGTFPYRAEVIKSYVNAVVSLENLQLAKREGYSIPVLVKPRYWFNESLNQDYIVAVGTLAVVLSISPAVFSALLIVKEKESGSIYNIYVSSVRKLEYLLGKLLAGFTVSTFNFSILLLILLFLFKVPLKGSFLVLLASSLLFIAVSTAFGLLLSVFFRSQAAAFIGTVILTVVPSVLYTGYLTPVSSMGKGALLTAHLIPTFYYMRLLKSIFFKASSLKLLLPDLLILTCFFFLLFGLNYLLFKKRER